MQYEDDKERGDNHDITVEIFGAIIFYQYKITCNKNSVLTISGLL